MISSRPLHPYIPNSPYWRADPKSKPEARRHKAYTLYSPHPPTRWLPLCGPLCNIACSGSVRHFAAVRQQRVACYRCQELQTTLDVFASSPPRMKMRWNLSLMRPSACIGLQNVVSFRISRCSLNS